MQETQMNAIIVHYAEIAIKGKNRPWFERLLIQNIAQQLRGMKCIIKKVFGRILIEPPSLSEEEQAIYTERLQHVFGISDFSFVESIPQNIEAIKKTVSQHIPKYPAQTVRVLTKRSNKQFPLTSVDINRQIGELLIEKHNKTIDLVDADQNIYIEIAEKYCFVYFEKIPGLGGLPIGSSGKVIVLLSGGIDSPVAAWYMMKRGCQPVYLHFHSHPYTNIASQKKVERLIEVLAKYQPEPKAYFVPFIDIQKEIMKKTDKKYRVIMYRRYMVRIAELLARRENAKALVTGENLAQVASQTTENMAAIEDATSMLMLRPLVGFDKQEIINKAKDMGTYEISIEPHEDCCSLFIPKHPAIKSDIQTVREAEKGISEQLIKECLDNAEKKKTNRE